MELKPKITVIGVGGAGGNAVNNMIRLQLLGVDFVVGNTDVQSLGQSLTKRRIKLGMNITQGLGAGSRPEVGRAAAEESLEELMKEISGSNMIFITAGMGGGTGTGAAPVIAQYAREMGILTVAVVTKPFNFEGNHRMKTAEKGIEDLQQYVDTLIVIPNQNLFRVANEKTTFSDAFKMADDVLYSGVRGVTDLMMMPGLINLDFADIRAVMGEMGKAMMGTGEAEGDNRAILAAEAAISNPLLDDVSMKGARGVLINITGGNDMTLFEVDEAANRIREEVDPDANIIFGSTFDETLSGKVRVSVVATGIDAAKGFSKNWMSRSKLVGDSFDSFHESLKDKSALKREEESAVEDISDASHENQLNEQESVDTLASGYESALANEGVQTEPVMGENEDLFTERQEDFFQHIQESRHKKKGFFGRFADRFKGISKLDEEGYDEDYEQQYVTHAEANLAKNQKAGLSAENDMLDIPSYMRRKNKNS
ncbi:MAG: cell division protein FtsZ [Alphaproteobacteria bacterium]|nr:cell division protein FtsZ [Alphaproteobacteria bacterium]MBX9976651.1 cell division protein FtsZ [Alphaproteobacteria bacterium]